MIKEILNNKNLPNYKYRDLEYPFKFDVDLEWKCLNINSLSRFSDNCHHLINKLKVGFVILGFTESRIVKSHSLLEQTYSLLLSWENPNESTAVEALLCVNKNILVKLYKPKNRNLSLLNLFWPRRVIPVLESRKLGQHRILAKRILFWKQWHQIFYHLLFNPLLM